MISLILCNISEIGTTCKVDHDCYVPNGIGVTCDNTTHTCKCLPGYHSTANNSDCRLDAKQPNDPCVESTDCLFSNAMCQLGQCKCKENYFLGPDSTCLPGDQQQMIKTKTYLYLKTT